MKKLMIIGLMVGTMTLSLTGCGGNSKNLQSSSAVPNDVLDEFYDRYPNAEDVSWKFSDGLYQADFEIGDDNRKATFTSDGDFVRGS